MLKQLVLPCGRTLDVAAHVTIFHARITTWPSQMQESDVQRRIADAFRLFPWRVAGEVVPLHDAQDLPHRLLIRGNVTSPLAHLLASAHGRLRQITGGSERSRRGAQFHVSLDRALN